jgi:hypothetical protein
MQVFMFFVASFNHKGAEHFTKRTKIARIQRQKEQVGNLLKLFTTLSF